MSYRRPALARVSGAPVVHTGGASSGVPATGLAVAAMFGGISVLAAASLRDRASANSILYPVGGVLAVTGALNLLF